MVTAGSVGARSGDALLERLTSITSLAARLDHARQRPLRADIVPLSILVGGHLVITDHESPESVYLVIDRTTARQLATAAITTDTIVHLSVAMKHAALRLTSAKRVIGYSGSPAMEVLHWAGTLDGSRHQVLAEAELALQRQSGDLYTERGSIFVLIPTVTNG